MMACASRPTQMRHEDIDADSSPHGARVALLVNFIPPYRLSLLEALQSRLRQLRIFVSTPSRRTGTGPRRGGIWTSSSSAR